MRADRSRRVPFARRARAALIRLGPMSAVDFGPIFRRDARIAGRRKQTYWLRLAAGLLLVGILSIVIFSMTESMEYGGSASRMRTMTTLGSALVLTIGWTQFIVLTLVGPMLTAGAISEERHNRTLHSLFTTPLSGRAIVAGKMTSRLMQAAILGLLPLPVLLMLRAFGGVSLETVAVFAVLSAASTLLGASLGIAMSGASKRSWTVMTRAVLVMLLVNVVPFIVMFIRAIVTGTPPFGMHYAPLVSPALLLGIASAGASAGPFSLMGPTLWTAVGICAGWQVIASFLLCAWTATRLRAESRNEAKAATRAAKAAASLGRSASRPSRTVIGHPILWRELRQPLAAGLRAKIIASLVGAGILIGVLWIYAKDPEGIRSIVPVMALSIGGGFAYFLFSISRTTGLISLERETRTWDTLLTTPLPAREIAYAKVFGATAKLAGVPVLLCAFVFLSSFTGSIHWIGAPLLFMALASGGFLLACTGLLFGAVCRKTATATIANFLFAGSVWVGPFVVVGLIANLFRSEPDGILSALIFLNPFAMAVMGITGAHELAEWRDASEAFNWPAGSIGPGMQCILAAASAALNLGAAALAIEIAAYRIRRAESPASLVLHDAAPATGGSAAPPPRTDDPPRS